MRPSESSMPPAARILLALAGFLALSIACSCSGGLAHRSTAELEGRIELPDGITRMRLEIANGSARVLAGEGRHATFRGVLRRAADTAEDLASLEAIPPTLSPAPGPDGAEIIVRSPDLPAGLRGGNAVLACEMTLTVPAELGLSIAVAGSGHLEVEDRAAAVDLTTTHGNLRLMRCRGSARIHTGRGMTIVYDHRGDLDAESRVGDMQVFVREPGRLLRLVAGLGNVQCLVPPDAGFRLDARTERGRVANGFGFVKERLADQGAAMVGSRGDGRTEIVMRAGAGFLSLTHKTFE
jgi:hypothetical protein